MKRGTGAGENVEGNSRECSAKSDNVPREIKAHEKVKSGATIRNRYTDTQTQTKPFHTPDS